MRAIRIDIKKLGSHWYPDIDHDNVEDLIIDEKIERLLNKVDSIGLGSVSIYISSIDYVDNFDDVIIFDEDDMMKFLTTSEDFELRFKYKKRDFLIDSSLLCLIEVNYKLNFHTNYYKIELW